MTSGYDQHNITHHKDFSYLFTGVFFAYEKKKPIRSKRLIKHVYKSNFENQNGLLGQDALLNTYINLTNHKKRLYM